MIQVTDKPKRRISPIELGKALGAKPVAVKNLSEIESRALVALTEAKTCTELGEILWGFARKGGGPRQSWARSAGRVLHRLKKAGRVIDYWDTFREHTVWKAT